MEKGSENYDITRDSFIFYRSFYEAIKDLKDEIRLEVFTAITEYALYGKFPGELKPVAKGLFTLIKPNLDVNNTRYENGKKGGRKLKAEPPRSNHDPNRIPHADPGQAPQTPQYSSFEQEIELIKADRLWQEPVCMQFRIDRDELEKRLDTFVTHCKVERDNELHPSLKDAKRHFTSWMRIAYAKTQEKNNQPPEPDDYTFNGGFGGLD